MSISDVLPTETLCDRLSEKYGLIQVDKIGRKHYIQVWHSHLWAINQGRYATLESVSENPAIDCLWLGAPEPTDGARSIEMMIRRTNVCAGV